MDVTWPHIIIEGKKNRYIQSISNTSHFRYHKKKSIDFEAIAKSYVAFVAGIPHVQEKIVVGVFPSSWQVVAPAVHARDWFYE